MLAYRRKLLTNNTLRLICMVFFPLPFSFPFRFSAFPVGIPPVEKSHEAILLQRLNRRIP